MKRYAMDGGVNRRPPTEEEFTAWLIWALAGLVAPMKVLVRTGPLVEDALGAALVRVWESWLNGSARFNSREHLLRYLRRTVRWLWLDMLRREKRHKSVPLTPELAEAIPDRHAQEAQSPTWTARDCARLRAGLRRLSKDERFIVLAHYLARLTDRDVAAILSREDNLPAKHALRIFRRRHAARRRLRQLLKAQGVRPDA